MSKDSNKDLGCNQSEGEDLGCCHIEGIVSIDKKGQIVIPKSLRDIMGLNEGDKLIVIGMRDNGVTNSISLIRADEMEKKMVKIKLEY